MMNPGMGGGNPQDVMAKVDANKSMLNPTDVSMMKQDGQMDPNMPVRDYLAKFGIDVDGPVSQLSEIYKGPKQKASMPGKMQALGGGPGMGQPQPRMPQGQKPLAGQGLEGLLGRM